MRIFNDWSLVLFAYLGGILKDHIYNPAKSSNEHSEQVSSWDSLAQDSRNFCLNQLSIVYHQHEGQWKVPYDLGGNKG